MQKKRIWELDFLRGFAMIMMIFDHSMYDLKNMDNYFSNFRIIDFATFNWLNDLAKLYWSSELRFIGHFFFVSLFLIVSGISFTFSKSNLSRGIKLLIVAVLISVVTYIIEISTGMRSFIIFGVIHMYAVSILITYILRKIWSNDIFIFTIGAGIVILGFAMNFWEFRYIPNFTFADLPAIMIGTKAYGADYFSIAPYTGVIMIGTVIGNLFYKNKMTLIPTVKVSKKNMVTFVGRNSLIIFLTHQFVLFALLFVIGYLFGYHM